MPGIGRSKKSFDGFTGCYSGNDGTKCCGQYEWLCRAALYGCQAMVGVGNIDHIIDKICEEARKDHSRRKPGSGDQ